MAILVVADDGPGIPEVESDRVFERFTRVDAARSAAAGGTGLGLAISREIVERHQGTVSLLPSDGSGARFEVRIPLAE
jgi:signal transduction histidine kinase